MKSRTATLNETETGTEARLVGRLAFACMAAAILSGLLLGSWEMVRPVFGSARYTLNPAPPAQLWSYGVLQAFKSVGFVSGLFGFFLVATRCGSPLKIIMSLAAVGGTFYAVVWIMIAVTARDDAIYVLNRPIGSDPHRNGGFLFLWIAPIAIGAEAFLARRISRWKSIWVIFVGLLGPRIFGLFSPGVAMAIEGVIWLALGYIVYISRRGALLCR